MAKSKMKPHKPAKVKDPIKTKPPGGDQTPGEKAKRGKIKNKSAEGTRKYYR